MCRSTFPLRIQMICLLSFLQSSPAQSNREAHEERECVCVCVCSRVECRTWVGSKEAVVSDMIVRRAVAAATAASLLVILHRW